MPIFNRQALTMAQVLSELPQVKNGEAFDISRPITLCTLDIICGMQSKSKFLKRKLISSAFSEETAMGKAINAQRQSESQYVQAICK